MYYLRRKIFQTFRYLLLILFLGYYCGITLFFHAHLVKGEIIVHSHPFRHDPSNKSPFEQHKHNKGEYALIHLLNKIVLDETEITSLLPKPVVSYIQQNIIPIYGDFQLPDGLGFQLRAPPLAA
jgi:hypothetical protein